MFLYFALNLTFPCLGVLYSDASMRDPQGKASARKEGQRLAVLGYFNKRADIPCFDTLNRVLYRKRHDTP